MKPQMVLNVSGADRTELEAWIRRGCTPQKQSLRARMILMSADGVPTGEIVRRLGTTVPTLSRWRLRYFEAGVDGLRKDKTRKPGRPPVPEAKVRQVLSLTTQPPDGAAHWTCRGMARVTGLSISTIHRIWKAAGIAPRRPAPLVCLDDPRFVARLCAVVGALGERREPPVLTPHERAAVDPASHPAEPENTDLCDSRGQPKVIVVAALDAAGVPAPAASTLTVDDGAFLEFLKRLDRENSLGVDLHLIVGDDAAARHAVDSDWLDRHPRIHVHFASGTDADPALPAS